MKLLKGGKTNMQIRDLVEILEGQDLILPDYFGRRWSQMYEKDSSFWNPKLKGIQILNDDGQRSNGLTERMIYDLEDKSYALTHIQTLRWTSTLCNTSYNQEDKLCLTYLPQRKSLVFASHRGKIPNNELWVPKLGIKGPLQIKQSGELFNISYLDEDKIVKRVFQGIEELN